MFAVSGVLNSFADVIVLCWPFWST